MELIKKYFPDTDPVQIEKFAALEGLYREWNQKINVISRKDMDAFNVHHLLHSLGIAKVIQFKAGTKVLDVGTGGGFPGIPLAILFPEVQFHLLDSIGKKIKVVEEVSQALELFNVTASHQRAEEHNQQYDFVVSRAVTRLNNFLPWLKGKLRNSSQHDLPNGYLFLKGGDLSAEIAEVKAEVKAFELGEYFEEDFFLTKKVLYTSPFS